jgi:hypothetical protein
LGGWSYQCKPHLKRSHDKQYQSKVVVVDLDLNNHSPKPISNGSNDQDQCYGSKHGLNENNPSRLLQHLLVMSVSIVVDVLNMNTGPPVRNIAWARTQYSIDLRRIVPYHAHQLFFNVLDAAEDMSRLVIPNYKHGGVLNESCKVVLLALRQEREIG